MRKKFSVKISKKIEKFNKKIKIPADKSLSLRALIFASQCIGISKIKNLLESDDVLNCIKILKKLGVKISKVNNIHLVFGNGLNSFRTKKKITKLYVGNSGTTARLLLGLLSTHAGKFYLYGDKSMNKRDMSRIIDPLEKIGCFFYPKKKTTLPLTIEGTSIPIALRHVENKGSAQVKSSFGQFIGFRKEFLIKMSPISSPDFLLKFFIFIFAFIFSFKTFINPTRVELHKIFLSNNLDPGVNSVRAIKNAAELGSELTV